VWKRIFKVCLKILLILLLLGLLVLLIPRLVTGLHAHMRVYALADVPFERVAIVFGAGLWRDGSPTPVLRDRVATAAELYFAGKVEKLLMSGDNRIETYNEPAAMREYALELGVPDEDIVLDFAGRRTYDTCYRAKDIFGLEGAIVVTQDFHLPRALYTCNQLGVESTGVEADRRVYSRRSMLYWKLRELGATLGALWDLHVRHPIPVLGEPEPIFPD